MEINNNNNNSNFAQSRYSSYQGETNIGGARQGRLPSNNDGNRSKYLRQGNEDYNDTDAQEAYRSQNSRASGGVSYLKHLPNNDKDNLGRGNGEHYQSRQQLQRDGSSGNHKQQSRTINSYGKLQPYFDHTPKQQFNGDRSPATQSNYNSFTPNQVDRKTNYDTFGNNSMPTRDKSPYGTHSTISKNHNSNTNAVGDGGGADLSRSFEGNNEIPPPTHVKAHMVKIQTDNASLLRRLNLVMQELDRVNQEKEDMYERSQALAEESAEIQQIVNLSEDAMDNSAKGVHHELIRERERSQTIKLRLKALEVERAELVVKLRRAEVRQGDGQCLNETTQGEVKSKAAHIADIEKEQYYTQEKIKQVNAIMEKLRLQNHQDSQMKCELEAVIDTLRSERDDLLNRLDHLTAKYDECVKEIAQGRTEMETSNGRHKRMVAAKVLFQELEMVARNKLNQGMADIKSYCEFDVSCKTKLKTLACLMTKCGQQRIKGALQQWFGNALQPVKSKQQSLQLAQQSYQINLRQKMFYKWQSEYNAKIDSYSTKNKAVKKIWQICKLDTEVEQKRAFAIWKDIVSKKKLQQSKVKKLIWRLYFNKLSQAMSTWQTYSNNIDTQVRFGLLSQNFSQKQYMTVLFHNFKYQTIDNRRRKQNRLFHALKAWQDYIRHKKFLMAANLSAMHFQKQQSSSLSKACFDAIKQHKEQNKYKKLDQYLNGEILPQISELSDQIANHSTFSDSKQQALACKYVKNMLSKQVHGYFSHWRQVNEDYKVTLKTTVRNKVLKLYLDSLRKGFTLWRANSDGLKVNKQQCIVEEMQESQAELNQNVMELQKDVKDRKQQLDQSQNKRLHRCVLSFQRRLKQLATGRWKDRCTAQQSQEGGAEVIIKRMRNRMLRKAFDMYREGSKYQAKIQIEQERCAYLINTRNERLKRQVYNSWHIYRANFISAKNYLNRIYIKCDLSMKERAMKQWKQQSQKEQEQILEGTQNSIVGQLEETNAELGSLHSQAQVQQAENSNINNKITKQAQRVLANAYVKYYYVGHTRGFEKWREFVRQEKRKEALLKKMVNHWRHFQFQNVKSTFQKFIASQDIQVKSDLVKKESQRVNDLAALNERQGQNFSQVKDQLNQELNQVTQLQNNYNQKCQKTISMIVNRVDGNHYMSQKRFIIQQWREYVKREKNFVACIQNVIQKSLWSVAFDSIREASRTNQKDQKITHLLNKFRCKFWQRNCASAFSLWKSGAHQIVQNQIEDCEQEIAATQEEHQTKIVLRKKENAVQSSKVVQDGILKRMFVNWKFVIKSEKLMRTKKTNLSSQYSDSRKQQALQKWNARVKATKLANHRVQKLQLKMQRIRKMLVFRGMRDRYFAAKDFLNRISNLANIHDQQAIKMGYNSIKSYVKAKNYVYSKQQEHSAREMRSILSNLLARRMSGYMKDLKLHTGMQNREALHKVYTILRSGSGKMRHCFLKWKEENSRKQLIEQLNEEGPVRAEVFEQKKLLENCKRFMEKEGYSEAEIDKALNQGVSQHNQLMLKAVKRMQHFNEELNCKPSAFDRWRQYVHARKLFKYWLGYVEQRDTYVKSDLAQFFAKWKNYQTKSQNTLAKLPKDKLETRMIKNCGDLDQLANQIHERDDKLARLGTQQGVLLDKYVGAQKLALSLLANDQKRSLHKAFLRWSKQADGIKQNSMEVTLKKKLQMIAALKDKISQLMTDNECIGSENEELRQFSLDGYEMAKNVQTLSQQRQALSVDLADKAQTIRKLLDENEILSQNLRNTQSVLKQGKLGQSDQKMTMNSANKYQQNNSTNANTRTGGLSFASPATRLNNQYY